MGNATTTNLDIAKVNLELEGRQAEQIVQWAVDQFGNAMAMSTSFGAESAVLLHLATQVKPDIKVLFVNTGFLFDETLVFRDQLTKMLNLNLIELKPEIPTAQFIKERGELWKHDPDACCAFNKIAPFQRAIPELGLRCWLAGLRRDQSPSRSNAPFASIRPDGVYKLHPIASWNSRTMHQYLKCHSLPFHPLYEYGYASIGCTHCTRSLLEGENSRAGRWSGASKTECGLHEFTSGDGI